MPTGLSICSVILCRVSAASQQKPKERPLKVSAIWFIFFHCLFLHEPIYFAGTYKENERFAKMFWASFFRSVSLDIKYNKLVLIRHNLARESSVDNFTLTICTEDYEVSCDEDMDLINTQLLESFVEPIRSSMMRGGKYWDRLAEIFDQYVGDNESPILFAVLNDVTPVLLFKDAGK